MEAVHVVHFEKALAGRLRNQERCCRESEGKTEPRSVDHGIRVYQSQSEDVPNGIPAIIPTCRTDRSENIGCILSGIDSFEFVQVHRWTSVRRAWNGVA